MDSYSAMARGMAASGQPMRVFDWHKAVEIIKARGAKDARAGLQSDMEWTGGSILENGEPVPSERTYTYLASKWATPIIEIDGEEIECWSWQKDTPEWDAHTYWPDSARAMLKGGAA